MLVVDLLHEFELGVWKALFIHLLRILESVNPNLLHELDRRWVVLVCFHSYANPDQLSYRQIPTFGRDTIRRFSSNISELKKLAARDFEDLLQVKFYTFRASVHCSTKITSVLSQHLMVFSQNRTIAKSCACFSHALIGTAWPSSGCILTSPWISWMVSRLQ
jgi:hypothetical protein